MSEIEFYTINKVATAEIVEKRSRFIANAYNVESKKEAEERIKELKKKYYDAKHNCFAFSVIENNILMQKTSDDGEPSGTAGMPILNIINKNNLNNILIVVTRYFGGILLGTGGLTRAYSRVANDAINNSDLLKQEPGLELLVEVSYTENEKFKFYCEKNNINIINVEYNENISYKIELNEKEYEKIVLKNKTNNEQSDFNIKIIRIICRKCVKKPK